MIPTQQYGAGLEDGYIKLSDGSVYDIGAIVSAEGEPQLDDVEVNGDDERKATFYFNQREELTIVANAVLFDVIQAITGNSYSSSEDGIEIPLGTESEQNPPFVEVGAYSKAKDDDGNSVKIKKVWHRVQIATPKVTQSGENEFNMELTGIAYPTAETITGAALSPKRTATLSVFGYAA